MNKLISLFLLVLLLPLAVLAVDFDETISPEDQQAFDQILEPVMRIYNFIKYAATALAVIFLVFAGITFIINGNDNAKREQAKSMGTYIVMGLLIIWVAPLVVSYLVR